MTIRILAACSPGEIRVAVADGDVLLDYAIDRPGAPDGVGDIHRGRILSRVPAMAGAFVVIAGAEGFLPDSDGAAGRTEGDILTVRVTRAAQGGKGPRLRVVQATPGGPCPALLQRGPSALDRLAAQHPDAPVLIDNPAQAALYHPSLGIRLSIVAAAFDDEIATATEALAQPSIDIPGGGTMHIQPTSALVAIDIDAGSRTAARASKTIAQRHANRAIIPELARQIRLRNLSGAIVVDFAGMPARRRAALGPELADALQGDPQQPRFLGFTNLGLAEIVRPRTHPPLHERLAGPHAAGLRALRRLAEEIAAIPTHLPTLRAAPAVVAALQTDPVAMADITHHAGRPPTLRADPALPPTSWTLEP